MMSRVLLFVVNVVAVIDSVATKIFDHAIICEMFNDARSRGYLMYSFSY